MFSQAIRVIYPLELLPLPPTMNPVLSKHLGFSKTSRLGALFGLLTVNLNNDPGTLGVKLQDRENCGHHKTPTAQVLLGGVMYVPFLNFKTGHLAH